MVEVLINVNRQIAAGLLTRTDPGQAGGEDPSRDPAAAKPEGFSI